MSVRGAVTMFGGGALAVGFVIGLGLTLVALKIGVIAFVVYFFLALFELVPPVDFIPFIPLI